MTKQEIYDRVLIHLRTQRVAAHESVCKFLTSDGRSCAVGCLMSREDALRAQGMGAGSIVGIAVHMPDVYAKLNCKPDGDTHELLHTLQSVHDTDMPRNSGSLMRRWELQMLWVADCHGLTYIPNLMETM